MLNLKKLQQTMKTVRLLTQKKTFLTMKKQQVQIKTTQKKKQQQTIHLKKIRIITKKHLTTKLNME